MFYVTSNNTLGCATTVVQGSGATGGCSMMTELSNFAVSSNFHQIIAINLSSDDKTGLLLGFENPLGRLVMLRGSGDPNDSSNWSWEDETDTFNTLLAENYAANIHIASECDFCRETINSTVNLKRVYLYCFARSDNSSDDRSYDETIVEFNFLVGDNNSPDNFTVEVGQYNVQPRGKVSLY